MRRKSLNLTPHPRNHFNFTMLSQCPERDSNPQARKERRILSRLIRLITPQTTPESPFYRSNNVRGRARTGTPAVTKFDTTQFEVARGLSYSLYLSVAGRIG